MLGGKAWGLKIDIALPSSPSGRYQACDLANLATPGCLKKTSTDSFGEKRRMIKLDPAGKRATGSRYSRPERRVITRDALLAAFDKYCGGKESVELVEFGGNFASGVVDFAHHGVPPKHIHMVENNREIYTDITRFMLKHKSCLDQMNISKWNIKKYLHNVRPSEELTPVVNMDVCGCWSKPVEEMLESYMQSAWCKEAGLFFLSVFLQARHAGRYAWMEKTTNKTIAIRNRNRIAERVEGSFALYGISVTRIEAPDFFYSDGVEFRTGRCYACVGFKIN